MEPVRIPVPAREGRAVELGRGDRVRIIDVEGGQVADVFAFATDDPAEYLSAGHTRAHTSRLFPGVGEAFVTNRRRPILGRGEDTSAGVHDLLMAPCDAACYAALGQPGHPSCVGNLHAALAAIGRGCEVVPHPINASMNVSVAGDGELSWLPAVSAPGESVTFEALIDCVVVVSACPQDLVPINGGNPTHIAIEVTRADECELALLAGR